ncbi:hypothetical protein GCM10023189_47670 [Nibrella saemangeumensis]|uniref:DUF306 domain-containing protein n=1 Tax=Nibrella saemangeumensis TaxID=1084526 RepID=A0ABP8NIH6_9BACT
MKTRTVFYLLCLLVLAGSCRRENVPDRAKTTKTTSSTSTSVWEEKRKQGVDFTAFGGTPAWSLDVDFAKNIRLKAQGNNVLTTSLPEPKPYGKNGGVLLDTKTGTGRLRVTIEPAVCKDDNGREYAYSVVVEANKKRYTGCGAFLRAESRLNDTWVLESFKGQRLRPELFSERRLPYLAINVKDSRLEGYAGCNQIGGKVQTDADQVQFEPVTSTRKACASKFESDFLNALRSATLYRVGKNRLTLLSNGQYVMTFRKKN